jgi:hypothetical protein
MSRKMFGLSVLITLNNTFEHSEYFELSTLNSKLFSTFAAAGRFIVPDLSRERKVRATQGTVLLNGKIFERG